MARRSQISVENNFVKGLITETTELKFPENACTEASNVVFDPSGRACRRTGIDLENNYALFTTPSSNLAATSSYMWSNASGSGDLSFVVVQINNILHFYDVTNSSSTSPNKKTFTVNLDSYRPSGAYLFPANFACAYAQVKGGLLVANKASDTILVKYSSVTDKLTVMAIEIKTRDFAGLDSGLDLTERPSSDLPTLATGNPEHYYNLINQGWASGGALGSWDAARTDLPSDADVVSLYRASETSAFDNARVLARSPGNTPAPKGHFILSATNPNRTQALVDDGIAGVNPIPPVVLMSKSEGTIIGNFTNPEKAFDAITSDVSGAQAFRIIFDSDAYLGKKFSFESKRVSKIEIRGSNNLGYSGNMTPASTITIDLYAKQGETAPLNATDGTLIGTLSFTENANESPIRTITSTDQNTFFSHVWVRVRSSITFRQMQVGDLSIYGFDESGVDGRTTTRPTSVAFFASRAVYAGIGSTYLNNNIFFSQIIENDNQYEKCYQANDPASEDFADLLATDGGVIRISEMANVTALFTYQSSLIVFATNGVWLISGTSGNGFRANDYSVRKISSVGTNSPKSVVDYKGIPIWWTEEGINTIKYDPNFDSFTVTSLTTSTIDEYFFNIPPSGRNNVVGVFDQRNQLVYWTYSSAGAPFVYDNILVLDPSSGAFYPFTISAYTVEEKPQVNGVIYVFSTNRTVDPSIKFITMIDKDLTFSEFKDDQYSDWKSYSENISLNPADKKHYLSYFVTGYKIHSETQRFNQANYVFVFMENKQDAGCKFQSIYDFTTTPSSGRWSSVQRVEGDLIVQSSIKVRRLKVRGKGRSIQFKFSSIDDKPFCLIGWSARESQNADV